jgi:hypothetical protein
VGFVIGTCDLRLPWAMMGVASKEIQDALREAVAFPQAEVRPRKRDNGTGTSEHVFTVMVTEAYADKYKSDMILVLKEKADKLVADLKADLDDPDFMGRLSAQDREVLRRDYEEALRRADTPLPIYVAKLGGWQTFTFNQKDAVEHKAWAGTIQGKAELTARRAEDEEERQVYIRRYLAQPSVTAPRDLYWSIFDECEGDGIEVARIQVDEIPKVVGEIARYAAAAGEYALLSPEEQRAKGAPRPAAIGAVTIVAASKLMATHASQKFASYGARLELGTAALARTRAVSAEMARNSDKIVPANVLAIAEKEKRASAAAAAEAAKVAAEEEARSQALKRKRDSEQRAQAYSERKLFGRYG